MAELWTDGMTFLPDMNGVVHTAQGSGMVLAGTPENLLRAAGEALRAPLAGGPDVQAVRQTTRERLARGDRGFWRGALAAALLLDTWMDTGAEISVRAVERGDSRLAEAVLDAAGRERLHLVLLSGHGRIEALGLMDEELILAPAAGMADLGGILPERLNWYDRLERAFRDPTGQLNQRDRRTLAARLRLLGGGAEVDAFAEALEQEDRERTQQALHGADADSWKQRVLTVAVLSGEKTIRGFSEVIEKYRGGSENPLLALSGKVEPFTAWGAQTVWRWNQVPFARFNAETGAEASDNDGMSLALGEAAGETSFLLSASQRCLRELPERLGQFRRRFGAQFPAETGQAMDAWRDQSIAQAAQPLPPLQLIWPWRTDSDALRTVLDEQLGEELARAAADPFSERLTIIDGGDLGSEEQNAAGALQIHGFPCVVVPPVGDRLAERLARALRDGGPLPASFRYEAGEEETVTACMTLRGNGTVTFQRTYPLLEQYRPEAVPEVALWPAVPMPENRWRAYWLSIRGEAQIRAMNEDRWQALSCPEEGTRVLRVDRFPAVAALWLRGKNIGALIHTAPAYVPDNRGTAVAAVDPGMSAVAMALKLAGEDLPVELPSLWHVLLRGAKPSDLSREPLPVWSMGPVLMNAVELYSAASLPQPFEDGRILPMEAERTGRLLTGLTWRTDEDGQAARLLMLRETMLILSFHAVMCGADRVAWRMALPSGLSAEGEELLRRDAQRAADLTARDCGLPCEGRIEWISAAAADALHLRAMGEASGSFAALNIGSASSCASLWLRGMERPALLSDLGGGVFHMLSAAYTAFPWMVDQDFAGVPELPLDQWAEGLRKGGDEISRWEARWQTIENMLGTWLGETAAAMNLRARANQMTCTQALLLLGTALRLYGVSLMLAQLGEDSLLNDQLPQEMDVLLCGCGLLPLERTEEPYRSQTLSFLSAALGPEHPVRRVLPRFSMQPKRETASGLLLADRPGDLTPLNTNWAETDEAALAERFLITLLQRLPQAALLLFPGVYSQMGFLMPEWDVYLRRALDTAEGETPDRLAQAIETLMLTAIRQRVQPSGGWSGTMTGPEGGEP